jgi:hypothetical protein
MNEWVSEWVSEWRVFYLVRYGLHFLRWRSLTLCFCVGSSHLNHYSYNRFIMFGITEILDPVHSLVLYITTFRKLDLFPSSRERVETPTLTSNTGNLTGVLTTSIYAPGIRVRLREATGKFTIKIVYWTWQPVTWASARWLSGKVHWLGSKFQGWQPCG